MILEQHSTVDSEARVDIAVLNQRLEHMNTSLVKHMEMEEKQRDKFEESVSTLSKKVGGLSRLLWLTIGMVGGPSLIEVLSNIPIH